MSQETQKTEKTEEIEEIDFLYEDASISGQKFGLISFAEPLSDVFEKKKNIISLNL